MKVFVTGVNDPEKGIFYAVVPISLRLIEVITYLRNGMEKLKEDFPGGISSMEISIRFDGCYFFSMDYTGVLELPFDRLDNTANSQDYIEADLDELQIQDLYNKSYPQHYIEIHVDDDSFYFVEYPKEAGRFESREILLKDLLKEENNGK